MAVPAAAAKSLQLCPTLCNPIDGSPPGPPRPWDSPGKNTGVGCHFLLQYTYGYLILFKCYISFHLQLYNNLPNPLILKNT